MRGERSESRTQNSAFRIRENGYGKHKHAQYSNVSGLPRCPGAAGAIDGVGAESVVGLAARWRGIVSPAGSQTVGFGAAQSGEAAGDNRAIEVDGRGAG